ncbi:hypothetical protein WJX72_001642 [[Myrmecia] bisecta]|uniref:Uncharacterized protein n=1 Tax=[Myrmecia] bisecta TaxID=41462 RepID=A0AAW1R4H5_9CHLO
MHWLFASLDLDRVLQGATLGVALLGAPVDTDQYQKKLPWQLAAEQLVADHKVREAALDGQLDLGLSEGGSTDLVGDTDGTDMDGTDMDHPGDYNSAVMLGDYISFRTKLAKAVASSPGSIHSEALRAALAHYIMKRINYVDGDDADWELLDTWMTEEQVRKWCRQVCLGDLDIDLDLDSADDPWKELMRVADQHRCLARCKRFKGRNHEPLTWWRRLIRLYTPAACNGGDFLKAQLPRPKVQVVDGQLVFAKSWWSDSTKARVLKEWVKIWAQKTPTPWPLDDYEDYTLDDERWCQFKLQDDLGWPDDVWSVVPELLGQDLLDAPLLAKAAALQWSSYHLDEFHSEDGVFTETDEELATGVADTLFAAAQLANPQMCDVCSACTAADDESYTDADDGMSIDINLEDLWNRFLGTVHSITQAGFDGPYDRLALDYLAAIRQAAPMCVLVGGLLLTLLHGFGRAFVDPETLYARLWLPASGAGVPSSHLACRIIARARFLLAALNTQLVKDVVVFICIAHHMLDYYNAFSVPNVVLLGMLVLTHVCKSPHPYATFATLGQCYFGGVERLGPNVGYMLFGMIDDDSNSLKWRAANVLPGAIVILYAAYVYFCQGGNPQLLESSGAALRARVWLVYLAGVSILWQALADMILHIDRCRFFWSLSHCLTHGGFPFYALWAATMWADWVYLLHLWLGWLGGLALRNASLAPVKRAHNRLWFLVVVQDWLSQMEQAAAMGRLVPYLKHLVFDTDWIGTDWHMFAEFLTRYLALIVVLVVYIPLHMFWETYIRLPFYCLCKLVFDGALGGFALGCIHASRALGGVWSKLATMLPRGRAGPAGRAGATKHPATAAVPMSAEAPHARRPAGKGASKPRKGASHQGQRKAERRWASPPAAIGSSARSASSAYPRMQMGAPGVPCVAEL